MHLVASNPSSARASSNGSAPVAVLALFIAALVSSVVLLGWIDHSRVAEAAPGSAEVTVLSGD